MTTETIDRQAHAEARAAMYRLLAQAFSHPSVDGLRALLEEDMPLADAASERFGPEVSGPLTALGHRLAHGDPEEVARTFERTFTHISSPDHPPYETAYASRGIFQQANDLADIAGFYAAYGLAVSRDAPSPPDHVSVEMEFMHLLTAKEAHALASGDLRHADGCRTDQRSFLRDHLGRWVSGFASRLSADAPGTAWADLADLTGAFIDLESRTLGVNPAVVDGAVEVEEPEEAECWAGAPACVFQDVEGRDGS